MQPEGEIWGHLNPYLHLKSNVTGPQCLQLLSANGT